MSDDNKSSEVYYRLARSTVHVSGVVTKDFDPRTTQPRYRADGDIAVEIEAEPRKDWLCKLPVTNEAMKKKEIDLRFAADGRLTSGKATTSGAGAAVIEASVRVLALVGSFAVSVLGGLVGAEAETAKSMEDAYATEDEDAAKRRRKYRETLADLQLRLADYSRDLATAENPAKLLPGLRAVQAALERVRSEAGMLDAEFQAWRSRTYPTTSEEHEFVFGTDELPERPQADNEVKLADLTLTPRQIDAARTLGLVVVKIAEVEEDTSNFTPELLQNAPGIWFRNARPVSLGIYEAVEPLNGTRFPNKFRLGRLTRVWVIDADSRLGFLRFDSGFFSTGTGAVEFGDTGAISQLSSSQTAAAQEVSKALSGVGTQLQESVDQAAKITDAFEKARGRGVDRQLADLKRRKELLQADIELKGALATRDDRDELERLKLEVDLLETRKKLGQVPEPEDLNKDLKAQIERAKLDLELQQIEYDARLLRKEPQG